MIKTAPSSPVPPLQPPELPASPEATTQVGQHLRGAKNVARPALHRALSNPPPGTRPLLAGLHVLDNLLHPGGIESARHPGSLSLGQSKASTWKAHQCADESLLGRVELHSGRGLMNLFASARFANGELSQTTKREVEGAITATLSAYNHAMAPRDGNGQPLPAQPGELAVSLHENHLVGDGRVHPHRLIPRTPNPRDYDFYHTLGVPFAENGSMLAHYHLEFNGPLTHSGVSAILGTLHSMGRMIDGREIISTGDVEHLLSLLPKASSDEPSHLEQMQRDRMRLPRELHTARQRAQARDRLRGEFHALSSSNTEKHDTLPRPARNHNMHMNSLRALEPECLFSCFAYGHTSLVEDLEQVESLGGASAAPPSTRELFELHAALRQAMNELAGASPVNDEERAQAKAMATRLQAALDKTRSLLTGEEMRPAP